MDGEPWFNKRLQETEIKKFIAQRSWRGTQHNWRAHTWRSGQVGGRELPAVGPGAHDFRKVHR